MIIAPNGSEIARHSGGPDSVSFPVWELLLAKDATFTHNHPGGLGPSLEDVVLAAQYSMREMRVVTAKERYVVTFRKGAAGAVLIEAAFHAEEPGALTSTRDDVRKGVLSPSDFKTEARHRTWGRVANRLGLDYWRESS